MYDMSVKVGAGVVAGWVREYPHHMEDDVGVRRVEDVATYIEVVGGSYTYMEVVELLGEYQEGSMEVEDDTTLQGEGYDMSVVGRLGGYLEARWEYLSYE